MDIETNKAKSIEREIVVNKVKIHVKSIFDGQKKLNEAVENIVIRKIADTEN